MAVTTPKFGGLYGNDPSKQVAWIGGPPKKDWSGSIAGSMKTPMCVRGLDPVSEMKGYSKRVLEGNSVKFKRDDTSFGLPSFAVAAKLHMETYGMDTIFYMVGTDDLAQEMGEELFTYHRKYTREQVKTEIDQRLQTTFDAYAKTALEDSAKWLVNSLDDTLKTSLHHVLDTPMTGPELWMAIVDEVMSDSLQRVDDLVKEFEGLKLTKYKGENVAEYCEEAGNKLVQLEKDDALPRMHLLAIINVFCDCSVMDFKIVFMGRRAAVEKFLRESNGKDAAAIAAMPNKITYKTLLAEGKSQYNNLRSRWGPAKAAKESVETAMLSKLQAMEAKLNQAIVANRTQSNGNNGDNGNGKGDGKKRKCFVCGSEDHLKKDCPKAKTDTTPGDDFTKWPPPKDNEPKKKTAKGGKTVYWCAKCNRGKGKWNESHPTDEHVAGWLKQQKAADTGSDTAKLAVEAPQQELVPSLTSWFS